MTLLMIQLNIATTQVQLIVLHVSQSAIAIRAIDGSKKSPSRGSDFNDNWRIRVYAASIGGVAKATRVSSSTATLASIDVFLDPLFLVRLIFSLEITIPFKIRAPRAGEASPREKLSPASPFSQFSLCDKFTSLCHPRSCTLFPRFSRGRERWDYSLERSW